MRRLLRYTLNGLTLLSAVLCVAVVVLWVRSHLGQCDARVITTAKRDGGWRVFVTRWAESGDGLLRVGAVTTTHRWNPGGDLALRDLHSYYARNLRRVGDLKLRLQTSHGPPPPPLPQPTRASCLGFTVFVQRTSPAMTNPNYGTIGGWRVGAPYWSLLPPFAALPAWWLLGLSRRRRQRTRINHGLCPRCGYDLRATPDRCPECGAAVPD